MTQLLSISECSKQLDVSAWTVRELVKAGKLVSVKVGAAYKFRQQDIDAFVDANTTRPKVKTHRRGFNPVPLKDRIFS